MSWERLESATIDPQLDEGLEARLGDPAWLLARQWQAGEFRGEDAANPLLIQLEARSIRVDRVATGDGRSMADLDADTPARAPGRARAGARPGRAARGSPPSSAHPPHRPGPPAAPAPVSRATSCGRATPSPCRPTTASTPSGRRRLELLARRSPRRRRLGGRARRRRRRWPSAVAADVGSPRARGDGSTASCEAWRARTSAAFREPAATTAWDPSRMEYRFDLRAATAEGDVRLVADGYAGGRLEWHHFDRADTAAPTAPPSTVVTRRAEVLPVAAALPRHAGARGSGPSRRATCPSAPSTSAPRTWPESPWPATPSSTATTGTSCRSGSPRPPSTTVTSLRVLDDFGGAHRRPRRRRGRRRRRRSALPLLRAHRRPGPARRRGAGAVRAAVARDRPMPAGPLEDVRFMRDEVANLAWAVEHRVESAAGRPVDLAARAPGRGRRRRAAADDRWRLVLSTPVPDNWVPLVPVRLGAGGSDPAPARAGPGAGRDQPRRPRPDPRA